MEAAEADLVATMEAMAGLVTVAAADAAGMEAGMAVG